MEEIYIEKFKKHFIRFLKDNKAYVSFMRELGKQRNTSPMRYIEEYIKIHHTTSEIFFWAITWYGDSCTYFNRLNTNYNSLFRRHNGILMPIEWKTSQLKRKRTK